MPQILPVMRIQPQLQHFRLTRKRGRIHLLMGDESRPSPARWTCTGLLMHLLQGGGRAVESYLMCDDIEASSATALPALHAWLDKWQRVGTVTRPVEG